jgi:sugar lactone lactonase YvrE
MKNRPCIAFFTFCVAILSFAPIALAQQIASLATRASVQNGDGASINEFTIQGTTPKKIYIRGLGPSDSSGFGVSDPTVELRDSSGNLIAFNDNWKDSQQAEIQATNIPPNNDLEAAIVATLNPGTYIAIERSKDGSTGSGRNEVYDLDITSSTLTAVGTRSWVLNNNDVQIGSVVVDGGGSRQLLIRALGPSLNASSPLTDPILELRDDFGSLLGSNDNWQSASNAADISATGLAPSDPRESAILTTLPGGTYTSIVRGNTIGVGFIQVYALPYSGQQLNPNPPLATPTPTPSSTPNPYAFATLAGLAGSVGSSDGSTNAARFSGPEGVAVDTTGNVYVADLKNGTIRKISAGGVVTTVAGLADGFCLHNDGTGSAARFCFPEGVAVDGGGNIYVADTGNGTIRKITDGGVVSTFAGLAENGGSTDGTGSAARFGGPRGIAVDGSGNFYVADSGNNTIRKITPSGVVTTLAGCPPSTCGQNSGGNTDGTGSAARFNRPRGVAVDGNGNVYVADSNNSTIRKITPGGVASTLAGAVTSDVASRFDFPTGVAVDSAGNVYVADSGNNTIRKVTPDGTVTTLAGLAGSAGSADGIGSAVRFNSALGGITGVAVDSAGVVYVGDSGNDTIRIGGAPVPAQSLNISTRLNVLTGDNVLIGGFILTGNMSKKVMLRAIGPSLASFGVTGALADPTLELHRPDGSVISNDNWKINDATGQSQEAEVRATTIPPTSDLESALVQTLPPGAYTAIVKDKNGGTGVGLVEIYDLDQSSSTKLANISTRGFVGTGTSVMIGGFILGNPGFGKVIVRAIGPSLPVAGALADPTLELHDGYGALIASNDNWKINDQTGLSQEADIRATTVPPTNDLESAIVTALRPGNYTAVVAGKNGATGVAVVELYNLQ